MFVCVYVSEAVISHLAKLNFGVLPAGKVSVRIMENVCLCVCVYVFE